jgi:tryptophan 7-halogenase
MQQNRVQSIAIVGGGTAGWMTAASLAKILGPSYAKITLVESDDIGIVGVGEATIPQIGIFNRLLGIDENDFIRRTKGTFKLGIEFVDWGAIGQTYFHPFGKYGVDMEGVSFHAFWQRLSKDPAFSDVDAFSLMALAARQRKFMRPIDAGNSPLSGIAYAFQFDAGLYALYLRELAENMGVERIEGRIAQVIQRPESGFIDRVVLESGKSVSADLFIDCSGFHALLIGKTLGVPYVDWSHYLPCDRAIAVPCASVDDLTPFTRSTAQKAGWQWRIPLQHRTGNGHVYCSEHISDDEACATLLAGLDGEQLADPRFIRFTAGHRAWFWDRNCVAIGLSSGFMEPLESTSIWMIQNGISRLLANFPDRNFDPVHSERYNRLLLAETEMIRDFIVLHYKVTSRNDSAFWDYCRNMTVPERLAEKIRIFEASGRTFRENDELFNDTSWFAVMTGQGLRHRDYDAVADLIGEAECRSRLQHIRDAVAKSADYMPSHRQFIAENCAA